MVSNRLRQLGNVIATIVLLSNAFVGTIKALQLSTAPAAAHHGAARTSLLKGPSITARGQPLRHTRLRNENRGMLWTSALAMSASSASYLDSLEEDDNKHRKKSKKGGKKASTLKLKSLTIQKRPGAKKKGSKSQFVAAIYKFTRPHTIRGTILASITGVARALVETPQSIDAHLFPVAFIGMFSLLLGNAYIVGINQIYDVKIDKINKPFLPIAAGELTKRAAWGVVAFSAIVGPLLVYKFFSKLIFGLYMFGLVIGGLYSVPPFQFKRFPLLAGLTIACVRGFLLNFGVYNAVKNALGQPFRWNPAVIFLARFMTVFAGVIAVSKDLPDVAGDKKYNIETFASKNGVAKTAKMASVVLLLNYVSAVVQGAMSPAGAFNKRVMIGGHFLFTLYLGRAIRELNEKSQTSVKRFYKRIWDLFYMEYMLYPFL